MIIVNSHKKLQITIIIVVIIVIVIIIPMVTTVAAAGLGPCPPGDQQAGRAASEECLRRRGERGI